MKHKTQKN